MCSFCYFSFNESSLNRTIIAGSDLKIKLYPKDKYDNQIKDSLFDKKEFLKKIKK